MQISKFFFKALSAFLRHISEMWQIIVLQFFYKIQKYFYNFHLKQISIFCSRLFFEPSKKTDFCQKGSIFFLFLFALSSNDL